MEQVPEGLVHIILLCVFLLWLLRDLLVDLVDAGEAYSFGGFPVGAVGGLEFPRPWSLVGFGDESFVGSFHNQL